MRIKGTEWIKSDGLAAGAKLTTIKVIRPFKDHGGYLGPKNGYWCEEQSGRITIVNMKISRYKLLKHYTRVIKRPDVF